MTFIQSLAEQYGINPNKPFFPVNSLRLLYFIIVSYYTQGSAEAIEKIGSLIPKVEAVFSARLQHRNTDQQATFASDITAVQAPLNDVFSVIDTPKVRMIFDQLFTYIYPIQDHMFVTLYGDIMSNQSLTKQHLLSLLHVRAMDSVVFATLINEITAMPDAAACFFHLHLLYQINDIVDSVAFAQDDLNSSAFSLFQVIRHIAPEPTAAKEFIKEVLSELVQQVTLLPFPADLQSHVSAFGDELRQVITGPQTSDSATTFQVQQ